jgi:hypothetical protein
MLLIIMRNVYPNYGQKITIKNEYFPITEVAKAHDTVEKSGSLGKICLIS